MSPTSGNEPPKPDESATATPRVSAPLAPAGRPAEPGARDSAHWDAVEEATELLHEERFREALVALRDVIKADGTNPYAFYFLGVGLFEVGELEPSRDAYRACLRLSPTYLGARVALTHVLRQLGDVREALKEGTQALSQSPGDPDALHAIGLVYLARGDKTSARRYLEAFMDARPEFEVGLEVRQLLEALTVDVDISE
jgi:tetratricopeptide (TPR) repeat protein